MMFVAIVVGTLIAFGVIVLGVFSYLGAAAVMSESWPERDE